MLKNSSFGTQPRQELFEVKKTNANCLTRTLFFLHLHVHRYCFREPLSNERENIWVQFFFFFFGAERVITYTGAPVRL